MSEKKWYSIEVGATPDNREALEYGLMEAGALGTETVDAEGEVRVTGYFEHPVNEQKVRQALVEAWRLYHHIPAKHIDLKVRSFADRDWLAEWKKSWQLVQVGRFIIAPPWIESVPGAVATGSVDSMGSLDPVATAPGSDTITILINPGMAFGTGTHETTRLCLKAIDKYFRGGSFIDVGTGTGVLVIAAAKCQKPDRQGVQSTIDAYDTDADTISIAKENAKLNGVADRINLHVGTIDEQTPSADFVCANLTAPVIVELLPPLIGATCGRLVLSGILDSQEELITSRLTELGVADFEIDRDGEWVAFIA